MLSLFAQSASNMPSLDTLGNWTAFGGVLWYLWYDTATAKPKRDADHATTIKDINAANAAAIKEINAEFNALITKIVTDFRDEMRVEREAHNAAIAAQRDDCRREVEVLLAAYQSRIPKSEG